MGNSSASRLALSFFPDIGKHLETEWLIPNKWATGHGPWGSYFERFGLRLAPAVIFHRMSITYVGTAILLESLGSEHGESFGKLLMVMSRAFFGLTEEIICCCRQPDNLEEG